jgi:Fe-S cluster biosynthesis and repair protein YggX
MVKKIRVIDEVEEQVPEDFNKTILELAKAMDWKMWELLQTMQRLEKKLSVVADSDDDE